MASNVDDEYLPPTEFVVSTIIFPGGSSTKNTDFQSPTSNLMCTTCWRPSSKLICPKCVLEIGQLFGKQELLRNLLKSRCERVESLRTRLKPFMESAGVDLSKFVAQSQIAVLRSLLALRQENLVQKAAKLKSVSERIAEKRRVLPNLRESLTTLETWSNNVKSCLSKRQKTLEKRLSHLTLVRQQIAADLFKNVFSLDATTVASEAKSTGSISTTISDDSSSMEVVDALCEATLTNYCQDRWIFMGRQAGVQYRIVHSCIIADFCDYAHLTGWLFSRQTDVPMTDSLFSDKCALGALSALAYLTQMTSILSRIFDAPLPFDVRFADFYGEKLTEDEFETLNFKLNGNVAFLCAELGLSPIDCVCLSRPFWNMFNFLNNVEAVGVGGERPFIVDGTLARDYRRAFSEITWKECPTVVEQSATDEWENVNDQIPEWSGAPASPPMLAQFLTSATSSMANLFKTVHG